MSVILAPLGWFYGSIMWLRRRLYRSGFFEAQQLPGTVISVGNLELGGTGKSPVVMALAHTLLQEGARPAILTRGYRSGLLPKDSAVLLGSQVLLPAAAGKDFHADEATMQAQKLAIVPVIIGAQRWKAAQRYLRQYPAPTHWILDDGFQHIKLKRQIDIVLLDADNPLHNGRCLPAGRLREFPSTLMEAHLLLLTRAKDSRIPESLQKLTAPVIPVRFSNGHPQQLAGPLRAFSEHRAVGLALGIAQPHRMIEHCRTHGYPITDQLLTADHDLFPMEKLQTMAAKCSAILTSEKDFWRQPEALKSLQVPLYILPLETSFPAGFDLSRLLAKFTPS